MRSIAGFWVVFVGMLAVGCSGSETTEQLACETGDLRPCMCDAGGAGIRTCMDGEYSACDCSESNLDARPASDAQAPTGPVLAGRIFDADSGESVAGAHVGTDLGDNTQTGADGRFALASASEPRELSIRGEGIARSLELSPANATYVELFVKRFDARFVFDADEGAIARTTSGARMEIPKGSVRNKSGEAVHGPVTLELAEVNGKDREQASALPGDMEAKRKDGKVGRTALPGALNITLRGPDGEELDVDKGANVIAELPVREADAAMERTSYSYDEGERRWVEEGKARRTVNDRGERVYRIEIEHLSWWSYGDFFEQLGCVSACVQTQSGDAVASAQIWMVGASFAGVQSLFTDQTGCVRTEAPVDSELVLVAQAKDLVSRSRAFEVPKTPPADCHDAGVLVLEVPRADACPAGFSLCGGRCVDVATDSAHCGSCDQACAGESGRTEACVAGVCACAADTMRCESGSTLTCAQLTRDPAACGDCDTVCSSAQECVSGACASAICPPGTLRCGAECIDVQDNDLHCGACGKACEGEQQCVSGMCLALSIPVLEPDAGTGADGGSQVTPDAGMDAGSNGMDAGAPDAGPGACPTGFDECDNLPATLCEADLSSVSHCGACDNLCTTAQGTPGCANDACTIASCNTGYDDCDLLVATGCETTLASNPQHCGECGRDCAAAGATCATGMCSGVTLYSGRPYGSDNSGARTWAFGNAAVYHIGYNSYSVERLPVDGSGVGTVWAPTSKTGGTESLWVTDTAVIWAERGAPSVVISKPHTAQSSDLPTVLFTPEYQPQFLRIRDGNFYWASGDYQSGDPAGYIYSRAVSAPASDPGTRIVTANQGNHGSIVALSVSTDAIYWVTSGPSGDANPYHLRTTPLTGGTPSIVPGGAITGGFSTAQVSLQSVGNTLYFNVNVGTSFLNGVYRYTPGDAAPTQLVSQEDVMTMLVDDSSIYFLQQNAAGVFKAPRAGGAATQISNTSGARLVGQDATYLYLTSSSCCQTSLLKIVK